MLVSTCNLHNDLLSKKELDLKLRFGVSPGCFRSSRVAGKSMQDTTNPCIPRLLGPQTRHVQAAVVYCCDTQLCFHLYYVAEVSARPYDHMCASELCMCVVPLLRCRC